MWLVGKDQIVVLVTATAVHHREHVLPTGTACRAIRKYASCCLPGGRAYNKSGMPRGGKQQSSGRANSLWPAGVLGVRTCAAMRFCVPLSACVRAALPFF